MLAKYSDSDEISRQIKAFMDDLSFLLSVYSSGLICHLITPRVLWKRMPRIALRYAKRYVLNGSPLAYKSVGYHSFNLYAFSILKQEYPNHAFWRDKSFELALEYSESEAYRSLIQDNPFGYPYNPPGFENILSLQTFRSDSLKIQQLWLKEQLENCFDFSRDLMSKNTEDEATQLARIYEATRLSDLNTEVNIQNTLT